MHTGLELKTALAGCQANNQQATAASLPMGVVIGNDLCEETLLGEVTTLCANGIHVLVQPSQRAHVHNSAVSPAACVSLHSIKAKALNCCTMYLPMSSQFLSYSRDPFHLLSLQPIMWTGFRGIAGPPVAHKPDE
eukprot:scpid81419/ scgid5654/ 